MPARPVVPTTVLLPSQSRQGSVVTAATPIPASRQIGVRVTMATGVRSNPALSLTHTIQISRDAGASWQTHAVTSWRGGTVPIKGGGTEAAFCNFDISVPVAYAGGLARVTVESTLPITYALAVVS